MAKPLTSTQDLTEGLSTKSFKAANGAVSVVFECEFIRAQNDMNLDNPNSFLIFAVGLEVKIVYFLYGERI